jgi:hypothetical protein
MYSVLLPLIFSLSGLDAAGLFGAISADLVPSLQPRREGDCDYAECDPSEEDADRFAENVFGVEYDDADGAAELEERCCRLISEEPRLEFVRERYDRHVEDDERDEGECDEFWPEDGNEDC